MALLFACFKPHLNHLESFYFYKNCSMRNPSKSSKSGHCYPKMVRHRRNLRYLKSFDIQRMYIVRCNCTRVFRVNRASPGLQWGQGRCCCQSELSEWLSYSGWINQTFFFSIQFFVTKSFSILVIKCCSIDHHFRKKITITVTSSQWGC